MGDFTEGFDLSPPATAMTQADAVRVQRFGDNDVLHTGRIKIAQSRQVRDAAVATGFLIRSAGNFDGPGVIRGIPR